MLDVQYNDTHYTDDFEITLNPDEHLDYIRLTADPAKGTKYPTVSSDGWITLTTTGGADYVAEDFDVEIEANESGNTRVGHITISWEDDVIQITLTQAYSAGYIPIWKDTHVTSDKTVFDYHIELDGQTIFKGRAYRMPGENEIRVNVNKIVQNYLDCDINAFLADNDLDAYRNEHAFVTVEVYEDNESPTPYSTFKFLYDWSYEDTDWYWDSDYDMSRPINGHAGPGMYLLHTVWESGDEEVWTDRTDGAYDKDVCADWAIYYLNSYGGWDAFAIEGNWKQTDSITEHDYNRSFDNTTIEYEQGRYISEIVTNYVFHTGWLTDEQARNLANNLLGSNNIYVHDLVNDRIYPAIITNTSAEYKTRTNQGNKLVAYDINVRLSQSKVRK